MVDFFDEQNEGEKSYPVQAKPDGNPPWWPDGVGVQAAASFNAYGAVLYWNEAIDNQRGDVEYTIYWDTQQPIRFESGATRLEAVNYVEGRSHEYDCMYWIEGLSPGTEYHFAVRAIDDAEPPNEDDNTETVSLSWENWNATVIEDSDTDVDPLKMSLAADAWGRRLLVYYDEGSALLKSGYATGSDAWNIKSLSADGEDAPQASAALDSDGNAHAVYFDETAGNLIYGFDGDPGASTDWMLRPLDDSTGAAGACNSMALDDELRPVASYVDLDNRLVKMAWLGKSDAVIETIAGLNGDPVFGDASTSIVLAGGIPTVLLRDPDNGRLYLATRNSSDPEQLGIWTVEAFLGENDYLESRLVIDEDPDFDGGYALSAHTFDDNNAARIDRRIGMGEWNPYYFHFVTGPVGDAGLSISNDETVLTTLHFPSGWLNIRTILPGKDDAFLTVTDGMSTSEAGSEIYLVSNFQHHAIRYDYGVVHLDGAGNLVESRRQVPEFD